MRRISSRISSRAAGSVTSPGAGSGQAWAVGDAVYWDNTNKRLTKTATDNTKVGVAVAAKATTGTIGRFRLEQPA